MPKLQIYAIAAMKECRCTKTNNKTQATVGYTLFDNCFSIFVIAIVLHAAVCQFAK